MEIKVEKLSQDEIDNRGIKSWPIWEKEISKFDWSYDQEERCYLLEGEVTVESDQGNVDFKAGDFVTFPKGLSCKWDIKKAVRKHYSFF